MTEVKKETQLIARALGDVPAERTCVRCHSKFWSEGFGHRICRRCKSSTSWKSAVPSVDWRTRRR